MTLQNTFKGSLALAWIVPTTACATSPRAIDADTINARATRDYAALFSDLPDISETIPLSQAIARAIK